MLHIGCQLSSSKGFLKMGETALSIGADTFQFFTRNPRGSKAKAIDPEDAAALMRLLGLKSRDALRNNYLNPAIEEGLIQMTVPDKPTSRNQRYIKE